ncbi:hypothetical protein AK812_SmicGene28455 [Symbiodinium microadriaticum]|uniref:Uncharacterized protein n=1 Tax=Symbiodinium microadriaticum TaxID=2951 RepID=A0A1Q9D4H2_SYMMI|nr:hypothetical protein AK812_SmicGene28455 [Symbiodinium microadriaticum]
MLGPKKKNQRYVSPSTSRLELDHPISRHSFPIFPGSEGQWPDLVPSFVEAYKKWDADVAAQKKSKQKEKDKMKKLKKQQQKPKREKKKKKTTKKTNKKRIRTREQERLKKQRQRDRLKWRLKYEVEKDTLTNILERKLPGLSIAVTVHRIARILAFFCCTQARAAGVEFTARYQW